MLHTAHSLRFRRIFAVDYNWYLRNGWISIIIDNYFFDLSLYLTKNWGCGNYKCQLRRNVTNGRIHVTCLLSVSYFGAKKGMYLQILVKISSTNFHKKTFPMAITLYIDYQLDAPVIIYS